MRGAQTELAGGLGGQMWGRRTEKGKWIIPQVMRRINTQWLGKTQEPAESSPWEESLKVTTEDGQD